MTHEKQLLRHGKTLKLSPQVHKNLADLKWEFREETFDGVIRRLIEEYEKKK